MQEKLENGTISFEKKELPCFQYLIQIFDTRCIAIRPGGLFAQHSPSFSDMSGNMPHDQKPRIASIGSCLLESLVADLNARRVF